jgi:acyl-CoA synthetase (AMP-forming)/AMP-acid ligase II
VLAIERELTRKFGVLAVIRADLSVPAVISRVAVLTGAVRLSVRIPCADGEAAMTTVTTSYWPADTSAQTWGEVVAAFVRPAPGQPPPAPEELRAYCRERLAPYKTPAHWVFLDAFPMTASGKIQKYKLREGFTQRQPT